MILSQHPLHTSFADKFLHCSASKHCTPSTWGLWVTFPTIQLQPRHFSSTDWYVSIPSIIKNCPKKKKNESWCWVFGQSLGLLVGGGEWRPSTTLSLSPSRFSRPVLGMEKVTFWPHTYFSKLKSTAAPKECLTKSNNSDSWSCSGGKKRKNTHNPVFLNPCFYTKCGMRGR